MLQQSPMLFFRGNSSTLSAALSTLTLARQTVSCTLTQLAMVTSCRQTGLPRFSNVLQCIQMAKSSFKTGKRCRCLPLFADLLRWANRWASKVSIWVKLNRAICEHLTESHSKQPVPFGERFKSFNARRAPGCLLTSKPHQDKRKKRLQVWRRWCRPIQRLKCKHKIRLKELLLVGYKWNKNSSQWLWPLLSFLTCFKKKRNRGIHLQKIVSKFAWKCGHQWHRPKSRPSFSNWSSLSQPKAWQLHPSHLKISWWTIT